MRPLLWTLGSVCLVHADCKPRASRARAWRGVNGSIRDVIFAAILTVTLTSGLFGLPHALANLMDST